MQSLKYSFSLIIAVLAFTVIYIMFGNAGQLVFLKNLTFLYVLNFNSLILKIIFKK